MIAQLLIGSGLILSTILIAAMGVLAMEVALLRGHNWLMRDPQRFRLVLVVVAVMLLVIAIMTMGVWSWAITFHTLGAFDHFEEAMYFSLVAFTTLGFGDVLPPQEWRILAGMAAADGLLTFGLLTALMIEALRHVRLHQHAARGTPPRPHKG
ncbi:MAG: potassium channel family protein [Gemmobacter sp.]